MLEKVGQVANNLNQLSMNVSYSSTRYLAEATAPVGYGGAEPIQFGNLDNLLWGIVKTIQYYSLPVMAIAIGALGIMLIMSGDDTDRKTKLKSAIFNILFGGLLVFGAALIAGIVKGFVGGTP
jgi:hypothetical protein